MARLDQICGLNMGQSPVSSSYNENGEGMPFFQGNADFGKVHPRVRVWCSAPTKVAHAGDVLISVRAPIGALNIADRECCIGRGLAALTVNEELCNKDYLWYAIASKVDELNSKGTGSTFKAISKSVLAETEIPLPAMAEQQIVAGRLAKVDELIALRKEQLAKLDQLVKSRFIELFDGKGYPTLKWNEVFNTTTGKLDSNAMVENGEYPFFTCAKEVLRIDKYAFDQEALLLAGNNAAGKYDVKYYKGKFNAYQRTYVLELKEEWSYQLFKYQLEDKLVYLQQQSLGGLTKYLTLKILGELEFIVPPIDKQNEFTVFVKQTDKSKLAIQQSLDKLELLKKSLMQQYFG